MPEGPGPAKVRTSGNTRDAVREFFAAERRNNERIQKHELKLGDDEELPPYVPEDHPYPKAMYPAFEPKENAIVVADAEEERAKYAEGYYSTYAEALAAALAAQELYEADRERVEEPAETEPPPPPPPKRSHKKKIYAE